MTSDSALTRPPALRGTPARPALLPAAVAAAAALTIGSTSVAVAQSPELELNSTNATVRYEVSGAPTAGYITFKTNDGQERIANVTLPWSTEFIGFRTGGERMAINYVISAQSAGPASLTCNLLVDGKVVSRNSATGDPARVVCEHH